MLSMKHISNDAAGWMQDIYAAAGTTEGAAAVAKAMEQTEINEPLTITVDANELTDLLERAEVAHAEYEKGLGHRDAAWAQWYADWIVSGGKE
jgi:hypothetical protein